MDNLEYLRNQKILILDDQAEVIDTVKSILEFEEIAKVEISQDGREAIKVLEEANESGDPFNVVIADCNMPKFSGKEFVKLVRENDKLANLAILIMTGDFENNTVKEMLDIGANDFISKPFTETVLLRKIESVIKSINQLQSSVSFLPIRVSTLSKAQELKFDVFHFEHGKHRLLFKNNEEINFSHLELLNKYGVKKLYIEDKDEPLYQAFLDTKIEAFIKSRTISIDEKGELINDYGKNLIKEASIDPNEQNIKQLSKISNTLHEFLENNGTEGLYSIFNCEEDNSVYGHSLNVSSIVLMIVQKIIELHNSPKNKNHKLAAPFKGVFNSDNGTENFELLMEASMIHDVGRTSMEEMDEGRHAILGAEKLDEYPNINPKVKEIILHHEEFCDGTGFPNKLNRTQTSQYTKIISIADYCETEVISKELTQTEFFTLMKENGDKFMPQLVDIMKLILF
ncbi:MAG: response regulator RpfG family c-di-GMP phosphodiesterase [Bacteriovoracaceae bacterium]|jgi:response regulator RpfG family c-di-GMP phosphodiesterase